MFAESVIFVMLYTILILTDLVPVYKSKQKKAIIFCTGVFLVAFVLQFLVIFDVKLPRYAEIIEGIVKSVVGPMGE